MKEEGKTEENTHTSENKIQRIATHFIRHHRKIIIFEYNIESIDAKYDDVSALKRDDR